MECLKNEVETLKKSTEEKDLEIDNLKGKIKKLEEDAHNAKLELEAQVTEYCIKLTDWEVAYKTLEKESKLREADLLSLFEEQKRDISENISNSDPCIQNKCPNCDQLMLELQIAQQENSTHMTIIEELEKTNKHLLNEQQNVRRELRLLLEPAEELQEKIESHKTNLSILIATMYEENELLKLQLKDLQDYYSRHTGNIRDLQEVNANSNKLLNNLKDDKTIAETQNKNLKRRSLPDNTYNNHFKGGSPLVGSRLMQDTNDTLNTFGNNSHVGNQSSLDYTPNILQNDVTGSFYNSDLLERNHMHNDSFNLKSDRVNNIILQNIDILKDEMSKIKQLAGKLSKSSLDVDSTSNSSRGLNSSEEMFCRKCNIAISTSLLESSQIDGLSLSQIIAEKEAIERKYKALLSVDIFLSKLTKLEQDFNSKVEQHDNKLSKLHYIKNNELKSLQTENDALSNQIMKNNVEIEDMNKSLNKLCALKNELYASHGECKHISEDVATIKQHLDCSDMSDNLDETIEDAKVSTKKCIASNSQKIYELDKSECYNYYLLITNAEKESLPNDLKMLDVMKLFYNNLVAKHANECENLLKKLNDSEEARINMQAHIDKIFFEYTSINKTLQVKENDLMRVSKLINELNKNINQLHKQNPDGANNREDYKEMASLLKQYILNMLDYEFGISSSKLFDIVFTKYDEDLRNIEMQCTSLQSQKEILTASLETANRDIDEMKKLRVDREREYNLLKTQETEMRENIRTITLGISKKETDLNSIIRAGRDKLVELNIITSNNLILSESVKENINKLLNCMINQHEIYVTKYKQYESEILLKAKQHETSLVETSKELDALKSEIESLKEVNNKINLELTGKDTKIKKLETMYENLNISHNMIVQENIKNLNSIDKLTKECAEAQSASTMKHLIEDNERLSSLNEMIIKEREACAMDLQKAEETITQNKEKLDKMTSDIWVLEESVKEGTKMVELLKRELDNLKLENTELNQKIEATSSECLRLNTNIKTYENTVDIQKRMIVRLQKGKEEDEALISEKQTKIQELRESYSELQKVYPELRHVVASSQDALNNLKDQINDLLQEQVEEMEKKLRSTSQLKPSVADG